MKRIHYGIKGMSCAACVAHVERAVRGVVGEKGEITVSLLTNSVLILLDGDPTDAELEVLGERLGASVRAAGYALLTEPVSPEKTSGERKKRLVALILSAIFTLGVMYLSMGGMVGLPIPTALTGTDGALPMAIAQLLLTLPVIILNFKFFRSGFLALLHRAPNMDSLIAVGSGAALVYGLFAILSLIGAEGNADVIHSWMHDLYFESAAMILTLVSLGKLLESGAKDKASDAVRSLATLAPKYATVLRDGAELSLPVDQIAVGDILLIRTGELIPIDGEVIAGSGSTDESALTGESMPVEKEVGSPVRAACVLMTGALTVRATGVGDQTSLSRIIRLLEDTAASKAPIARIADRVSAVFVPSVMAISALTLIIWLAATKNAEQALRSAISVLVISCPCALGLATPTAITVGVGRAARNGILFRNAESLEKLCSIKTAVFDKTGTVTEGNPELTALITYGEDPDRVLAYAAAVERLSSHPLAPAVVRAAESARPTDGCGDACDPTKTNSSAPLSPAALYPIGCEDVTDFETLVGRGAIGRIEELTCYVGKPDAAFRERVSKNEKKTPSAIGFSGTVLQKDDTSSIFEDFAALEACGKTAVLVSFNGTPVGLLGISDRIRSDSREAIEALRTLGVRCLMLTGDNEQTAEAVARQADLDGYHASLLPEDKERMVREISSHSPCAMIGDGINDAPALVRADVGIAVGAGTEIAMDCADVVLSGSSLTGVSQAFGISRATIRIIKQNLFWALFYNAVCIPVAAGAFYPLLGWQLSPMLASAAMSCSSVFVVLNALRLRRLRILPKTHTRAAFSHPSAQKTADPIAQNSTAPTSDPIADQHSTTNKKGDSDMFFKKEKTYVIHVEGMMCPRCVAHVKTALEGVKGVKKVDVSLDDKTATVLTTLDSTQPLTAAIVAAGYEVVEG